ncbi:nitrate reductase cytochrome c-type subunit [uncultured Adlercreutzia sp.]|uniref:nitrate reductase cytochrome c-type subunit n=1 Tax=uncultured Adlercreutzia sp. TaxID=875803 RepID=UPI0025FE4AC3|nr:nitrate reductase cytochrome c-type subunit [uncultured Adlercreutzia sp.]MCI9261962.1 hypothetical protein [Eggerthellaceae bacterium]
MKKTNCVTAVAVACVLGLGALAGCSQPTAEAEVVYGPGEPPLMTASHEGRFESLGANGCYGCHGSSDSAEVFLPQATPLPDDHYVNGDKQTREIDGPRTECLTCHPVAGE